MRKLGILVMAMVLVFGMSLGVLAYDYENESSQFDVNVEIDTYAEFDLNDVNIATANGIEPGDNGDNAIAQGMITANYDYNIFVESEGLTDDEGNELEGVEYYAADYNPEDWVMSLETFDPGGDSGHAFSFYDNRKVGFEFGVNFNEDMSWEEFTAGEYSDTITVTLEAR